MMIQFKSILHRLTVANSSIQVKLSRCHSEHNQPQSTLTPRGVTQVLQRNQISLTNAPLLPKFIKSIECNQLASNNPIEDRIRVSSLQIPGQDEPTLMLGVFDGHGGGTTADLISRRLFNYIALSLSPHPDSLRISNHEELKNIVTDLHKCPKPEEYSVIMEAELKSISEFRSELSAKRVDQHEVGDKDIVANIKSSFNRCDDDLAKEIQRNLLRLKGNNDLMHYYLSAAVSGCCAIVMVIHKGIAYLASSGDCRAVMGIIESSHSNENSNETTNFKAYQLNDEHNCDNVNEIRRLAVAHPRSEENTMIKHNRLLGHLMPFRAFGDFNYKWPADLIKACGITRAFGSQVIPSSYKTPPYLIVEPDVNPIDMMGPGEKQEQLDGDNLRVERCLVIATDGLWELFESSRDVIETIVDHSRLVKAGFLQEDEYDENCATHIIRSALQSASPQDLCLNPTELKRLYHIRLESTLTLPQSVVRNFRDDISLIVLKL